MRQLIHGDCLDILPTLADQSIDMILCDLPYGKTAASWDSVLPMDVLWRAYKRLIKPRGAIVLTAVQPFTSMLIMSNPKWYRHSWVWIKEKGTGFQRVNYRPLQQHEDVIVFSRSAPIYNQQKVDLITPYVRKGRIKYSVSSPLNHDDGRIHVYTQRCPTSLLCFERDTDLRIHPTQKPSALFEYLIRTYTQPGATVLDHCAGSMSTAIAAIRTGRDYLCIERDAGYFASGAARVARELAAAQQVALIPQDAA